MGKCISHSQSSDNQINIEQQITIAPDSNPSEWTRQQVVSWLSSIDLNLTHNSADQAKLIKKFRKNKIDGTKLTTLTESNLKTNLKIKPIGLRLELMKVINRQKSRQPFPSPLYEHNKYELPQYYPFDYKYRVTMQQCTPPSPYHRPIANTPKNVVNVYGSNISYQKDRYSWTVGTVVLVHLQEYEIWCAAQIIGTMKGCPDNGVYCFGIEPKVTDYVTVIYDLGNGIYERKKICRFDCSAVRSDERFLRNRWKLQKNCMIEVYDQYTNEWIHTYIKHLGSKNQNDFIVAHKDENGINSRFDRWDPKIRCVEGMLNLGKNSELHVHRSTYDNKYVCCAKIIDIYDNDSAMVQFKQGKLNIFKVIYKTQNGEYWYKYIHQFSANILLLNPDIDRPSHYTDLEVIMHSNVTGTPIAHDSIDEQHLQLLLTGWLRAQKYSYYIDTSVDLVKLLTLFMNNCGYHCGPIYGLVMYLESKYWSGLPYSQ